MTELFIQLICAFIGAFGFAILFQVEKEKLLKASLGGLIAWGCYILCSFFLDSMISCFFISSAAATVYAEYMARKEKAPATVFLVPATIPLIPGGSLYQTFVYALEQNWNSFSKQGLETILLAVSISCGILFVMTVMKMYHKIRDKFQIKYRI